MRRIFASLMAVALLVGLTTSCEDEFQPQQQDVIKTFKGTTADDGVTVTYPDYVNQGDPIVVTFPEGCGEPMLQVETAEGWLTVDEGDGCGDTELSDIQEEYGVYVYQVVFVSTEACPCEVPLTSTSFEVVVCRTETAFGGQVMPDTKGSWWYYFDLTEYWAQAEVLDPETGELIDVPPTEWIDMTAPVTADTDLVMGEVTISYNVDHFELSMVLDGSWVLLEGEETVKVQGYDLDKLPNKRPSAGKFDLKGSELVVDLTDYEWGAYVIHLDVKNCDAPLFGQLVD